MSELHPVSDSPDPLQAIIAARPATCSRRIETKRGIVAESRRWGREFQFGGGPCDPCDANCDGSIDLTDVEGFLECLLG